MEAVRFFSTEPGEPEAARSAALLTGAGVRTVCGLRVDSLAAEASRGSEESAVLVLAAELLKLLPGKAESELKPTEDRRRLVVQASPCWRCGGEGVLRGESDEGLERVEDCFECGASGMVQTGPVHWEHQEAASDGARKDAERRLAEVERLLGDLVEGVRHEGEQGDGVPSDGPLGAAFDAAISHLAMAHNLTLVGGDLDRICARWLRLSQGSAAAAGNGHGEVLNGD